MNVMQNIQPISFLKTNTSDVVKQVQETREPVLITVNGKVQAVIQDPMSYQKMQDQLTMLRILAHVARLRRTEDLLPEEPGGAAVAAARERRRGQTLHPFG